MLGFGSGHVREAGIPRGRPKEWRLLAGAATIVLVFTARGEGRTYRGVVMLDGARSRSKRVDRTSVARGRMKIQHLLAGVAAMLLLFVASACGTPRGGTPSPSRAATSEPTGAISIPTGNLSAYYQCMLAAGWHITAVASTAPGEPPQYEMTRDKDDKTPKEAMALWQQCETLNPTPIPLTDAEIRVVYDRWVGEYQCLVGLGYQPDPPPSVETFVGSWNTGPWSPIDGVKTDHWTQAQYEEAKGKCTLEFYTHQGW